MSEDRTEYASHKPALDALLMELQDDRITAEDEARSLRAQLTHAQADNERLRGLLRDMGDWLAFEPSLEPGCPSCIDVRRHVLARITAALGEEQAP